jgi:hypothetical protein
MPVVHEHQLPVIYVDWAEWRSEQLLDAAEDAPPRIATFCVTCAGNGRIYEYAPNGEGLVPRPCVSCLGLGVVGA